MNSVAYKPVGLPDGDDNEDPGAEALFQDEPTTTSATTTNRQQPLEPFEIDEDETTDDKQKKNRNRDQKNHLIQLQRRVNDDIVWPKLAMGISIWLVCPLLLYGIVLTYQISGRIWTCCLFALHLFLSLIKSICHWKELEETSAVHVHNNSGEDGKSSSIFPTGSYSDNETPPDHNNTIMDHYDDGDENEEDISTTTTRISTKSRRRNSSYACFTSLPSLMDILLFGGLYPVLIKAFDDFFVDYDETLVYDWTNYYYSGHTIRLIGYMIVVCRLVIGGRMILTNNLPPIATYYLTKTNFVCQQSIPTCIKSLFQCFYYGTYIRFKICCSSPPPKPRTFASVGWKIFLWINLLLSMIFLGSTIYSAMIHFEHHSSSTNAVSGDAHCDPLDGTECCLPFPSFHHLQKDPTTETGYRVNLRSQSFPMLKGRVPIDTTFLNQLDGFSTMGPILFYMEGMKESHEAYKAAHARNHLIQKEVGVTRLRGHDEIELSVTPYSTTLLLDVEEKTLIHHTAEIDYLDLARPLVMVFPARPLKHNTHYAIAVINATDGSGNRLPVTPGMKELWETTNNNNNDEEDRKVLFDKTILPALEASTHKAAAALGGEANWGGPFGSFTRKKDPGALQLLFNFQTISKKSQLGPVRAVRDATLTQITHPDWNWEDHARMIRQIDGDCDNPGYPLARTIHGELDVPWFLSGFGAGYRDATLDAKAVEGGVSTTIGKAKFVVHVPCSLKRKALNVPSSEDRNSQPLRAVLEYGHGLFGSRGEASDDYLIRMADRNGYILMAMDWRGMSKFDYPVVLRVMLAQPSLFESVRDNLIQGYANKFALQHFSQNGMLEKDWFQFSEDDNNAMEANTIPQQIGGAGNASNGTQSNQEEDSLPSLFYGISQGGILGAGYVGLSGATGLISRGVLGVPGTSFSLILSRSLQFLGYDVALLMDFFHNRDVRIFLVLAQMCWDSVEGAGVFGQPVEEPVPPLILQAGLGDAIVSTLAAERLARAVGAHTLPHNPRGPIFGIPRGEPSNALEQDGPQAVLTEILYQEDYENLPLDDELTQKWNDVHLCVRLNPDLQRQIDVFFTEGAIVDPCENAEACVKKKAEC